MACINLAPAATCSRSSSYPFLYSNFNAASSNAFHGLQPEPFKRLSIVDLPRGRDHRNILKPILAAAADAPDWDKSMSQLTGSTLKFKQIEVAVESQDAEKLKLRVDMPGEETERAFGILLTSLSKSAPQLPGFRQQKGGKTSKIPKNLLVLILGKDRVQKFVVREIVTSAVANYVEEENLFVTENRLNTTQTEEELYKAFSPGNAFGFNVELELEKEGEVTEDSGTDSED